MIAPITIVDLFSGPGGLGEGFSSVRHPDGSRAYKINVSVEMDVDAHKTLRLRAFLRQFDNLPRAYSNWLAETSSEPSWSELYPDEWAAAEKEAICAELGQEKTTKLLEARISEAREIAGERTLLIGGPPCQAYSLVGRARNAGIKNYRPEDDHRNFLYQEYCRVLSEFEPSVFVMENVKGMLSSTIQGRAIFEKVMDDLESAGPGYQLLALSGENLSLGRPNPSDFVVRAEDYGVPQERHRVIIVGIKRHIANRMSGRNWPSLTKWTDRINVEDVLNGIPRLRSGLTSRVAFQDGTEPQDTAEDWSRAISEAMDLVTSTAGQLQKSDSAKFLSELKRAGKGRLPTPLASRSSKRKAPLPNSLHPELRDFLQGTYEGPVLNHETRAHMISDLARYLFAATFAQIKGNSPKAMEFPKRLAPNHANWESGKFNDRFRVQCWNRPSKTVTSHIKKDGHYFIHPDPAQCRSLTVREAARLQTFPEDYLFMGHQGNQYQQVGNAVPPFLAKQIAEAILPVFEIVNSP